MTLPDIVERSQASMIGVTIPARAIIVNESPKLKLGFPAKFSFKFIRVVFSTRPWPVPSKENS